METSCKNCCFAEYIDTKTQTNCKLNLLEKYKEKGYKVDECYDEEKEFFVIREKFCPYQRSHEWSERHKNKEEESVCAEVKLKYNVIIYNDKDNTDDVKKTFDSLTEQNPLPLNVSIVLSNDKLLPSKLLKALDNDLNSPEFSYKGVPWVITVIKEKDENGNDVSLIRSLDWGTLKFDKGWVSVFKAGYKVPNNFFNNMNQKLTKDLDVFVLVDSKDYNGTTFPLYLQKVLNGSNYEEVETDTHEIHELKDLVEKIRFYVNAQEKPSLIVNVEDLC